MRLPVLAVPALGFITLVLTGCGGSGSGSSAPAPPPPKPQYMYSGGVVNGNAAILSFPVNSTTSSVVPTVAALPGSADIVRALSTDGKGNLYAMTFQDANFSEIGIYVYSMNEGALTLERSFTNDTVGYGDGLAATAEGTVYISFQNGPVAGFSPTATGAALPANLYNVGMTLPEMATDASGNIWAWQNGSLLLHEFSAGFDSLMPMETFTLPTPPVGNGDAGICVDAKGNVYVSGLGQIVVFDAGATSATSNIVGDSTGLTASTAIATDSTGRIWVNNANGAIDAFAPGATGNVAPIESFYVSTDIVGNFAPSLVIY